MLNMPDGSPPKSYRVHRLLALMFVPNSDPKKTQVNHRNCNRRDNHIDNLEWVTGAENMRHLVFMGVIPAVPVSQFDLTGKFIRNWPSGNSAKIEGGFHNVLEVCEGSRKSAGKNTEPDDIKYQWRFTLSFQDDLYKTNGINPVEKPIKSRFDVIVQFDEFGKYIDMYETTHKAQSETRVDRHDISKACKSKSYTKSPIKRYSKQKIIYHWRYLGDLDKNFRNGIKV